MELWTEEHRPQSVLSRFEGKTLKEVFEDLKWQISDRGKPRVPFIIESDGQTDGRMEGRMEGRTDGLALL